jgi:hypothetical protein
MLQTFSEIIYENNESLEMSNSKNSLYSLKQDPPGSRFNSTWGMKNIKKSKLRNSMKSYYLKKNKHMNNLSSTSNLKKHLSTNKSLTSFYNKTMAKGQVHDSDSERIKHLEKIGHEKGVRKWEIKLVDQSNNESGVKQDYKPTHLSSSAFSTLKNFKTRASGLYHYKSQSNLHSTEYPSRYESHNKHDEIGNLEEKIKSMEEAMERQNEARERQNLEYEKKLYGIKYDLHIITLKLKSKDDELRTSRDQVSQLLRIIEQITKVHNKSSVASKTSESEDNHCIVIQEQLEISNDSDVDIDLNHYKTVNKVFDPSKLREIKWVNYETAEGSLYLVSPTWSNISEGNTDIYVHEVMRNVRNGRHDSSEADELELPESESLYKTLESLNRPHNRRKTTNETFEKLESLRTPTNRAFKEILQKNSRFDYDMRTTCEGTKTIPTLSKFSARLSTDNQEIIDQKYTKWNVILLLYQI